MPTRPVTAISMNLYLTATPRTPANTEPASADPLLVLLSATVDGTNSNLVPTWTQYWQWPAHLVHPCSQLGLDIALVMGAVGYVYLILVILPIHLVQVAGQSYINIVY